MCSNQALHGRCGPGLALACWSAARLKPVTCVSMGSEARGVCLQKCLCIFFVFVFGPEQQQARLCLTLPFTLWTHGMCNSGGKKQSGTYRFKEEIFHAVCFFSPPLPLLSSPLLTSLYPTLSPSHRPPFPVPLTSGGDLQVGNHPSLLVVRCTHGFAKGGFGSEYTLGLSSDLGAPPGTRCLPGPCWVKAHSPLLLLKTCIVFWFLTCVDKWTSATEHVNSIGRFAK